MQSPPGKAAIAACCCLPAVGDPKPLARYRGNAISRLAVMGGSYGNLPALRACLQHAREAGCDGFAFLGDATGFCGHSDETLALIRRHFPILVAGNYEQKAAAREDDCGCNYSDDEDNSSGSLAHQWAMRSLSDANRTWVGTWPDLAVLETGGRSLLLCHGSPAHTNEFLYESQLEMARLEGWLDDFRADVLVCTHSGFPWVRELAAGRVALNCGVCGKPDDDGDPAVHYAIIDCCTAASASVQVARVAYDHTSWADQLDCEGVARMFTESLRDGRWTCGVRSLPAGERARTCAVDPQNIPCVR